MTIVHHSLSLACLSVYPYWGHWRIPKLLLFGEGVTIPSLPIQDYYQNIKEEFRCQKTISLAMVR